MRLLAFIISVLLLAGWVDATEGWLIALTVVTGIAVFRPRFRDGLSLRPAIDLRLGSFIFATMLLAGAVEPTREWLIGLTVVTGFAMITPRLLHVDLFGTEERNNWCDWKWDVHSGKHQWRRTDSWDEWQRDFDAEMTRGNGQWREQPWP